MHGWINLNKPPGMTSAQAVSRVKRALPRGVKIGHAGTLDPLADGVLPLAIGEATKLISLLHMDDKTYDFSIIWGQERDTGDAEGAVVATHDHRPDLAQIERVLPAFRGRISQIPPSFSAIKIDGERAYDRARAGEVFDMPARFVDIHALNIATHSSSETFLSCRCGTGTYIRSLARDIARAAGSAGYVGRLSRTHVGPFHLRDAFFLDKQGQNVDKDTLHAALLPLDYGLDDILAVSVTRAEESRLRQGQPIVTAEPRQADPVLIRGVEALLGIGVWDDLMLRPKRLLNL